MKEIALSCGRLVADSGDGCSWWQVYDAEGHYVGYELTLVKAAQLLPGVNAEDIDAEDIDKLQQHAQAQQ